MKKHEDKKVIGEELIYKQNSYWLRAEGYYGNKRYLQMVLLFHDILYPARSIDFCKILRAGYSVIQLYSDSVSLSDNCFGIILEVEAVANIKKAEEDKKGKPVTVKLTAKERKKIEESAKKNNMSISAYMAAKSTQEGAVSICKESKRIVELVSVENALMVLREKIKNGSSTADILGALDNVDKEMIKIWRC